MKCEHCGATISFEDKFCKNCGMPNTFAKEHIADMEHFAKDYEETKENVVTKTKNTSRLAVRIVVIILLAAMIPFTLVIGHLGYDIDKWKGIRESKKNKAKYEALIKEYIDNEDFMALHFYLDNDHLVEYKGGLYDDYAVFDGVLLRYSRIYEYTSVVVSYQKKAKDAGANSSFDYGKYAKEYTDMTAEQIANFYNDQKDFLERLDSEYCQISPECQALEKEAIETMSEHIKALAVGVYGVSSADTAEFENLTESKIRLLFEEVEANEE
ncbi:MAG: zinc ribbon domain-containing protein [Lachnospiraceae bacterium]|nr:zinc ribbon domain-containing protein [Lachnospiraceae bacterium]